MGWRVPSRLIQQNRTPLQSAGENLCDVLVAEELKLFKCWPGQASFHFSWKWSDLLQQEEIINTYNSQDLKFTDLQGAHALESIKSWFKALSL